MYKLVCKEFGFDCDFTIKNKDKKTTIDRFYKHLSNNHDRYFPTKEISEFIENKNIKTDKNYDKLKSDKWFQGRKNFP